MTARLRAGALPALALLLVVALALAWHSRGQLRERQSAGGEATAAARSVAGSLTTYDYRSLGSAYDWVRLDGTSRFRRSFEQVSAPSRAAVTEMQVISTGDVLDAAPVVKDARHVRVLVYVDQSLRDRQRTQARIEQQRLTLQMVKQGDRWLVDRVTLETR